jgi:hypothetical protein
MRNWVVEHTAGHWSFLSKPSEQVRLALVVALIGLHGKGTVINFGRARGQLRQWPNPRTCLRYIGVDITAAAFRDAGSSEIASEWVEAGIEAYEPLVPLRGSTLIFSEVLYYVESPDRQLVRLCRALQAACVVVSITVPGLRYPQYRDRVDAIWQALDGLAWHRPAEFDLTDEASGERWRIAALIPS